MPTFVVRETEPPNLETPADALLPAITPNEQFYIRNHFPTPSIDIASWRLRIDGAVDRPLALSFDDICKLPTQTRELTMECAGNGRVFLVPKVKGVAWQNGAVGNVRWTGVPLVEILSRAGVRPSAVEVVLEGADVGSLNDDPKSPGPIAFSRSLPLDKARKPEVLLAWRMNDRDLSPEHGWPLRAVVGGWYGMASVKWLTRIIVVETPYQGFWQTFDYSYFDRSVGLPSLTAVGPLLVKAVVVRPQPREIVPAGRPYRIVGKAWAGEQAIAKVEVSVDGGTTWQLANLDEAAKPFVWSSWHFEATAPATGAWKIVVRATDATGRTQPTARDTDRRTYMINHTIPVVASVRG